MRLMLGRGKDPALLVNAREDYNSANFEFSVVNGGWNGVFTNGYISVLGCPSGDFTSLSPVSIICDNQDRLRGDYQDVFNNFSNEQYVAPVDEYQHSPYDEDDIPF